MQRWLSAAKAAGRSPAELNSSEYARLWRDVGRAVWEQAPPQGRWRTVGGKTREIPGFAFVTEGIARELEELQNEVAHLPPYERAGRLAGRLAEKASRKQ